MVRQHVGSLAVLGQRKARRRLAQRRQVCTCEALSGRGHLVDIHSWCDRNCAGKHTQNGDSRAMIWNRDMDQVIEAARTQQRCIDEVRPICCCNHGNLLPWQQAIELCKQLAAHTFPRTCTACAP